MTIIQSQLPSTPANKICRVIQELISTMMMAVPVWLREWVEFIREHETTWLFLMAPLSFISSRVRAFFSFLLDLSAKFFKTIARVALGLDESVQALKKEFTDRLEKLEEEVNNLRRELRERDLKIHEQEMGINQLRKQVRSRGDEPWY